MILELVYHIFQKIFLYNSPLQCLTLLFHFNNLELFTYNKDHIPFMINLDNTFVVLLILNIYCSNVSQMVFYQSKEASMIENAEVFGRGSAERNSSKAVLYHFQCSKRQ